MKIGEYSFKAPVFLAPMAGVTDTAYRIIAHDMGCPLCFAEMVSSQGIHFRNERTLAMLQSEPEERPLAMQIFANESVDTFSLRPIFAINAELIPAACCKSFFFISKSMRSFHSFL